MSEEQKVSIDEEESVVMPSYSAPRKPTKQPASEYYMSKYALGNDELHQIDIFLRTYGSANGKIFNLTNLNEFRKFFVRSELDEIKFETLVKNFDANKKNEILNYEQFIEMYRSVFS